MQARAWGTRHFEPTLSWRRLLLHRWLNDGSGMPSFHAEMTVHLNESLCAASGNVLVGSARKYLYIANA
jgi:hypothetical protein